MAKSSPKFRRYARDKKRASIGFDLVGDKELVKALQEISYGARYDLPDKVLLEAAVPMEAAVRANAPDSRKTGSRKKQSAKVRNQFSSSRPLRTTIRSVSRRMRRFSVTIGSYALVGPSYTDGGGHGNFFASDHKRKVYWGRDAGGVRVVNRFVKRAADSTRERSRAVLVAAIKRELGKLARRATRG